MKKKTAVIITLLLFGGWTFRSLISGIIGLSKSEFAAVSVNTEKGKLCEVEVDYAARVYTIEHTLNGLIPTGKEYYYFAASEDSEIPLLIKQKPSWYNKNFDGDELAYSTVTVVGEVKRFDSDSGSELRKVKSRLAELGAEISTDKYISGNYKTPYILRLASALLMLAAAAGFVVIVARKGSIPKAGATAVVILGIAALLFMAFTLLCADTV